MIEVKNISKRYRNTVLDDISFTAEKGQCIGIIGANGCGKSTLFNVITKNLKPQKGSVLLNGEDIKHISLKNFARQVAIVHQYNTAPSDITVEKLISYAYDKNVINKNDIDANTSETVSRLLIFFSDAIPLKSKATKIEELTG